MTFYSKIIGTGSYLPPKRVTNEALTAELAAAGIETSDEWIVSRSGISARHYADSGVQSSDLAVEASRQALAMAGLTANDIDLIILATSTPDFIGGFPSTACVVQRKLGIVNGCAAFDVQAVCSGFIYGISIADSFIKAGAHKNVLVIGAEIFSRILDFKDRTTCVLFGDGAGAVVLSASREPGILSTRLHADGSHSDILCVPGNVRGGVLEGNALLHMDGQAVFKLAVSVLENWPMKRCRLPVYPLPKLTGWCRIRPIFVLCRARQKNWACRWKRWWLPSTSKGIPLQHRFRLLLTRRCATGVLSQGKMY